MLPWICVHSYKVEYELEALLSKQASSALDFTSSLTPRGPN